MSIIFQFTFSARDRRSGSGIGAQAINERVLLPPAHLIPLYSSVIYGAEGETFQLMALMCKKSFHYNWERVSSADARALTNSSKTYE